MVLHNYTMKASPGTGSGLLTASSVATSRLSQWGLHSQQAAQKHTHQQSCHVEFEQLYCHVVHYWLTYACILASEVLQLDSPGVNFLVQSLLRALVLCQVTLCLFNSTMTLRKQVHVQVQAISRDLHTPYSGKLSREKTFANWKKWRFHEENFRGTV